MATTRATVAAKAATRPTTVDLGAFTLAGGRTLDSVRVAYETFGPLAEDGSNVVLACHALSGDSHVAAGPGANGESRPGWWDPMVGPGKAIDTDRYFVVCANVLGGCSGTTGPGSADPATGGPYGLRFPLVTIEDMVDVQAALLDHLGLARVLAVVGGSMGGMQALSWGVRYPGRVASVIGIATTWRLGAQAIAFNEVGRTAILGDPAFRGGDYYGHGRPEHGLATARMVGHITYLSDESMRAKFGRRLRERDSHAFEFVTEFEVESYLAHQGRKFVERFDANTYLYMTKAMDYFDLCPNGTTLTGVFDVTPVRWLLLSFSSDWLFPDYHTRQIVDALQHVGADVTYAQIESPYGHDAFLLEPEAQTRLVSPFLAGVREAENPEAGRRGDRR
jgi:homoserine O-acetyltransferase